MFGQVSCSSSRSRLSLSLALFIWLLVERSSGFGSTKREPLEGRPNFAELSAGDRRDAYPSAQHILLCVRFHCASNLGLRFTHLAPCHPKSFCLNWN